MASGFKEMIINTQERGVSTDINRLQRFAGRDLAECLRQLVNVGGNDDVSAGVATVPSSVTAPLTAEVLGGLLVRPQIGTLSLAIDEGVLAAIMPDGAADESNYKYVRDAGVASGSLLMTANASGFTRIDVIECRIDPIEQTVTDNRDIFDPTTGLFTATSVTKERQGHLEYRVRLGDPAAGYPAAASGWLPLAVASVPTGTTTNDTITFWDVRPLVSERAFQPGNVTTTQQRILEGSFFSMDDTTAPGEGRVYGIVNAACEGYRAGGAIRSTAPGTDFAYVDVNNVINQAAGFAYTGTGLYFVYLLFPFGLPRWARYTDFGSGSRVPRNPRGLIVVSKTAPDTLGRPSAPINLPAATGFAAGSTTTGMLFLAAPDIGGSSQFTFDGKTVWFRANVDILPSAGTWATSYTFNLTVGTHFPACARAVRFFLELQISLAADGFAQWDGTINADKGADTYIITYPVGTGFVTSRTGTGTGLRDWNSGLVTIPLLASYPTLTGTSIVLDWNTSGVNSGGAAAISGERLRMRGFDLC